MVKDARQADAIMPQALNESGLVKISRYLLYWIYLLLTLARQVGRLNRIVGLPTATFPGHCVVTNGSQA